MQNENFNMTKSEYLDTYGPIRHGQYPDLPIVFNPLNICLRPKMYSSGGGVSMTVPDQTMSLQTILTRFAHGQMPTGFEPQYHDDIDLQFNQGIDLRKLDLSEIHDLGETGKLAQQLHKNKLKLASDEKFKKDEEARFEAEYQRRRALETNPSTIPPSTP